jgi:tellurite methyltransferase
MEHPESAKWDSRYLAADDTAPQPAYVLQAFAHLLPSSGTALDLACGLGGNALFLAERGLTVAAWDLSAVAIARLSEAARQRGLAITAEVHDVVAAPPAAASFDVIVVSRFLERSLCPALIAALKPGGLLFYQTWLRERTSSQGPSNPHFLLDSNELLRLFAPLTLRAYREEGCVGDAQQGFRNEALLVAQRSG